MRQENNCHVIYYFVSFAHVDDLFPISEGSALTFFTSSSVGPHPGYHPRPSCLPSSVGAMSSWGVLVVQGHILGTTHARHVFLHLLVPCLLGAPSSSRATSWVPPMPVMSSFICWCHVFLGRPRRLGPHPGYHPRPSYLPSSVGVMSSWGVLVVQGHILGTTHARHVFLHLLVPCLLGASSSSRATSWVPPTPVISSFICWCHVFLGRPSRLGPHPRYHPRPSYLPSSVGVMSSWGVLVV